MKQLMLILAVMGLVVLIEPSVFWLFWLSVAAALLARVGMGRSEDNPLRKAIFTRAFETAVAILISSGLWCLVAWHIRSIPEPLPTDTIKAVEYTLVATQLKFLGAFKLGKLQILLITTALVLPALWLARRIQHSSTDEERLRRERQVQRAGWLLKRFKEWDRWVRMVAVGLVTLASFTLISQPVLVQATDKLSEYEEYLHQIRLRQDELAVKARHLVRLTLVRAVIDGEEWKETRAELAATATVVGQVVDLGFVRSQVESYAYAANPKDTSFKEAFPEGKGPADGRPPKPSNPEMDRKDVTLEDLTTAITEVDAQLGQEKRKLPDGVAELVDKAVELGTDSLYAPFAGTDARLELVKAIMDALARTPLKESISRALQELLAQRAWDGDKLDARLQETRAKVRESLAPALASLRPRIKAVTASLKSAGARISSYREELLKELKAQREAEERERRRIEALPVIHVFGSKNCSRTQRALAEALQLKREGKIKDYDFHDVDNDESAKRTVLATQYRRYTSPTGNKYDIILPLVLKGDEPMVWNPGALPEKCG